MGMQLHFKGEISPHCIEGQREFGLISTIHSAEMINVNDDIEKVELMADYNMT
jgi:hypothetical protein